MAESDGTVEHRWKLDTPSGGSTYEAYRDEAADPPALGRAEFEHQARNNRMRATGT